MSQIQSKTLASALVATAIASAAPAQAQMWFDVSGLMSPVVTDQCTGGRCGPTEREGTLDPQTRVPATSLNTTPASRAQIADLTYSVSHERRRANLASFAAKTRADNPESAERMRALFASQDVIGQIGAALAPYGYSVDNLADAYAFWWMTAWEGMQGSNRVFSREEMRAVQAQARNALLANSQLAEATDPQKQEIAEAMLIQAAMIDSMVDLAKQDPSLMSGVKSAIRKGARASGLDLDKMVLTDKGFVQQ